MSNKNTIPYDEETNDHILTPAMQASEKLNNLVKVHKICIN